MDDRLGAGHPEQQYLGPLPQRHELVGVELRRRRSEHEHKSAEHGDDATNRAILFLCRRHGRQEPREQVAAFNAIAEHLEYGRRYTTRTNHVQRSFEDTALKQRALELVTAA